MKKRIHLYELECYQNATEEQKNKMRISEIRYFDLEGLPSENIRQLLEEFIWDRGKHLAPSSLKCEILYYNNIRDFLMECNIKELVPEEEEKIIRLLKRWMLKHGYALSSQRYRSEYDKLTRQNPYIVETRLQNRELTKRNQSLEETNKELKKQLEKLQGRLKHKEVSILKSL